jgi:DNA-binding transcriptional ArsR family regulator
VEILSGQPPMGEERREILDALSDRTRYSILEVLAKKAMTGDEIAEAAQRSRSTVEAHLSMLLRLGLISRRKEEKKYYYEATPKAQMWMGRVEEFRGASPAAKATPKPAGRHFAIWLGAAFVGGALWFFVNTYIIAFPIWIFAILLGVVSAWLCDTMREIAEFLLITSLTIAVFSSVFLFGSFTLAGILLSFSISLVVIFLLGTLAWFFTEKARSYLRR